MLSPFVVWSTPGAESTTLRIASAVVVVASLAAGVHAFAGDLRTAYLYAGPSIFTPVDRAQIDAVRAALPEQAPILLIASSTDVWYAWLWQRGLYPEHLAVVQLEPWSADDIRKARKRYGFRHAVLIGPPPVDPGFRWTRDLGPVAGLPTRVDFGELAP